MLVLEKNIYLHLEAQRDLLPLLFPFNNQNYSQYLATHHAVLTKLASENPLAYKNLETYGTGASLSSKKLFRITVDLEQKSQSTVK